MTRDKQRKKAAKARQQSTGDKYTDSHRAASHQDPTAPRHQHRAQIAVAALPAPDAAIGGAARATALHLIGALEAECDCYTDEMRLLSDRQRHFLDAPGVTVEDPDDGMLLSGVHIDSHQAAPGPAEAVLADMIWCTARILTDLGHRTRTAPTQLAAEMLTEFRNLPWPDDVAMGARQVADMAVRTVDQGSTAEVALEFAQGITTVGSLLGVNGHDMLMMSTELALRMAAGIEAAYSSPDR